MTYFFLAVLVTLTNPDVSYVEVADSMFYEADSIKVELIDIYEECKQPWTNTFDFVSDTGIPATLVSSNVAVCAAHYRPSIGDSISFNGVYTTVQSVHVPDSWTAIYANDFCFFTVDPVDIEPCNLAPIDWYKAFEMGGRSTPVQIISRSAGRMEARLYIYNMTSTVPLVSGDSGSPLILFFRGQPVLIGVSTRKNGGGFSNITEDLVEVQRTWLTTP